MDRCSCVAVDMPTGLGEDVAPDQAIKADFTYSTGIAKSPIINKSNLHWTGRLRYLDLGFFKNDEDSCIIDSNIGVLRPSSLKVLRKLRSVNSDKRSNGHLFLLAGSRDLGGAAMMSAKAALKAGVGLLTVGIPESLHTSLAANCPRERGYHFLRHPMDLWHSKGLAKFANFLTRYLHLQSDPDWVQSLKLIL